jgi:hypothetical protein
MNWLTIKNFGKVKYFNISYAIIIVVPLMPDILEMLNKNFAFNFQLPLTVKSVYFASVIYVIAIAIYEYNCPPIIKEYENLQNYIEKNLEIFKNKTPDLKFNIVLANLTDAQSDIRTKITNLYLSMEGTEESAEKLQLKIELDKELNEMFPSSVQNYLTTKYNKANIEKKKMRWISGILYLVGTTIIFVLLILKTFILFKN